MNSQMVKLWIENEISKISYRIEIGMELPVSGKAKIELLRRFYDDFNLERVSEEVEFHDNI